MTYDRGIVSASAPGRCGIVGNPSDMYGGSVISCTTRERALCVLSQTSGPTMLVNDSDRTELRAAADLELRGDKLDVARGALRYFGLDPAESRIAVHLSTDIPMRAGLAGSTAMIAAIVGALTAWLDRPMTPYALAETTRKVEARVLGILCGFQDQHMAIFGGLNFMDFRGKQRLEQRDDEPYATVEPLSHVISDPPLVLAHTGVPHHSGRVHRSPRERWLAGEPLLMDTFERIAAIARTGKRSLIERDWARLGELMNENHALVSELGGSGPENDRLVEAARSAGAWGAKLAGAGGGGTIIALAANREAVALALTAAGAERILVPVPVPGLTVHRGEAAA